MRTSGFVQIQLVGVCLAWSPHGDSSRGLLTGTPHLCVFELIPGGFLDSFFRVARLLS